MATYACEKCGMAVNASCAKCHVPLVDDRLTLENGQQVNIAQCDETQIICNGDNACDGMNVQVSSYNNDKLNILCGNITSCDNMVVDIIGNINS